MLETQFGVDEGKGDGRMGIGGLGQNSIYRYFNCGLYQVCGHLVGLVEWAEPVRPPVSYRNLRL